MLILIKDANNNIIGNIYTDVNGDYSFPNIANGTYSIYPEAINYATTPFTNVVVNNGQVTNVSFRQHDIAMTITPQPENVFTNIANNSLNIYPNPTTGSARLQWLQTNDETAHIAIADAIGRTVYNSELKINAGEGAYQLNLPL